MRRQGLSENIKKPIYYQFGQKNPLHVFKILAIGKGKVFHKGKTFKWLDYIDPRIFMNLPGNHSSIFYICLSFLQTSHAQSLREHIYKLNNPTSPGYYVEGRLYEVQYMRMSISPCFFYIQLDGMGSGCFLHGL